MTHTKDPVVFPMETARGSNQSGMRAHNERLVLTLIRQMGPLAKAEIARLTGLSAQTVSVIMRALEADGLLQKDTPVRGKVGQPAVPMKLASDGAFFLGLKVGRRSMELVLTDFLGSVRSRVHDTILFPAPGDVVSFANDAISAVLADLPHDRRDRVAGLGIAAPFRLEDWAETVGANPQRLAGWRDCDIAGEISKHWDFPVYLQNDGSAACGAELVFGAQDKPRDFLYFFVGYFAGGGMVLDGTLYTGRTGNAAAVGSLPIRLKDGSNLQLAEVVSLASLENAMRVSGNDADVIWRRASDWPIRKDILDSWLNNASEGLAIAITSSSCLIDFECVVVDGWLPPEIRKALVCRTAACLAANPVAGIDSPEIREGTIQGDARVLGAASLPLSNRFLVDRNAFLKG